MEVLNINDDNYPEILKGIQNPPQKLYIEGNIKNLNKLGIAIVGSRKNSDYGEKMCEKFVKGLINYNINIISGLALGIDSIAHNIAIENFGITIAVLPCGFNNIYPKENYNLYRRIIEFGGTIISEYEPNVKYCKENPRMRNRIICGLSLGTLIIEGAYRSGTQITAKLTKNMGRPIFCIPNRLDCNNGYVTNNLIKENAYLVMNEMDILRKFKDIKFSRRKININKEKNNNRVVEKEINPEFMEIYKLLSSKEMDLNQICKLVNKSVSEINYQITMLQIKGLIKELPGRRFIKSE